MTSEVTVPEAASNAAWEAYKNTGLMSAALAAALPHLSSAIRDAVLEEAALKLDDLSEGYAAGAASTRRDWIGSDNSREDNEANRKFAFEQDGQSKAFRLGAVAIRALKGKSIPAPAEGDESRDRGKMVKPKPGAPAGGYGGVAGNEAEAAPKPMSEEAQAFADRDWWAAAGEKIGLGLCGWTFRLHAQFWDADARTTVHLPGSVAKRLNTPAQAPGELAAELTRPIIGIENRSAQEAFDIMADRIRHAIAALSQEQRGAVERARERLAQIGNIEWAGVRIQNADTSYHEMKRLALLGVEEIDRALAATPVHQEAGK